MRPELAALVVHDLKNALGALEAELEQLAAAGNRPPEHGPAPSPADSARARRSHRQCAELRQRFVQFLALYASDSGMTAHCHDESPCELLDSVASAGQDSLPAGLSLVVDDSADAPPFWYFDRRLVRMALDAALHNAVRFARSRIELAARSEAGYLVFSVVDDGPGLGAEDDSATSTGLGTALCESVAQAHGTPARAGRVTLANRPEGGARFELWLG